MAGKIYRAKIESVRCIHGDTYILRFRPSVEFKYQPGQFLSLQVPNRDRPTELLWRAYSFSLPQELARAQGYELCIKKMNGGHAGAYVEKLNAGDWITIRASYGEFVLHSAPERSVCFIGTGTGAAPLRAMALSEQFRDQEPATALAILGFRTLDELPFAGDFERAGVVTTYALSRETRALEYPFFKGRVTDVLLTVKESFPWQQTDFYLCGNSEMIYEVIFFLKSVHGVSERAIFAEAFEPAQKQAA